MGGFADRLRGQGGTVCELDAWHDAIVTEPKKLAATPGGIGRAV